MDLFKKHGKSIKFYIQDCWGKELIKQQIEKHGGVVSEVCSTDTIEIVPVSTNCISKSSVYSYSYIYECILSRTLLDLEPYKLPSHFLEHTKSLQINDFQKLINLIKNKQISYQDTFSRTQLKKIKAILKWILRRELLKKHMLSLDVLEFEISLL